MRYEVVFFYIAVLFPLLLLFKSQSRTDWNIENAHFQIQHAFLEKIEATYQTNVQMEGYKHEEY